jgi:two-component system sensor histidine kinase KdpD
VSELRDLARERAWSPSRPTLPPARRALEIAAVAGVGLVVATAIVAGLESAAIGMSDASPIYLLPVVIVGARFGTWPAVVSALVAFLVYDLLFTEPRLSLTVADPQELLDLLLFLVVAVATGRLAAIQRTRAGEAERRAGEAQGLFAISRVLATAPSLAEATPRIADRLVAGTRMSRIWIRLDGPQEAVLADTASDQPRPDPAIVTSLARMPGDEPARWIRSHEARRGTIHRGEEEVFKVRIEAGVAPIGTLWATRPRNAEPPSREETRLLSLAADQIGLAASREKLQRDATEAEIARRGDALKSALLDSVSHDLRTPLASIRAAAGGLADPAVEWPADGGRAVAASIDAEAERLDRLVREVLDLSRIEAGALRPDPEPHELRDLVEPVVRRLRPRLGDRPIDLDLPDDLPPVAADAVLFDESVANVIDNVASHAPPPAPLAISGRRADPEMVVLTIEDGGPGVPEGSLPYLFDKFYRVGRTGEGARRSIGIGLSIVRGLVEAMGGTVDAGPSPLGGLAIRLTMPTAAAPPGDTVEP